MAYMNLIINADLSASPTEILYFRFLTLVCSDNLKLDCLIETDPELIDSYYFFLKKQGAFDYIEQIVTPRENEFGLRLDKELNYPLTVIAKSITAQNCINIIGQINSLSKIKY